MLMQWNTHESADATARAEIIARLFTVEGKAEIVDGAIVQMSLGDRPHGRIARRILVSLDAYAQRSGHGEAFGDRVHYIVDLPRRWSFSPDVSFYDGPEDGDDGPRGPIFAVEVRSDAEYGLAAERAMAAKRLEYFAAGTLVVWDVARRDRTVRVFRASAPEQPTIVRAGELADADPATPGWRMAVDDLFAPPASR